MVSTTQKYLKVEISQIIVHSEVALDYQAF